MIPHRITRRSDWPELLHAFIESRRATPFQWGSNDCYLFPIDAVLAMTDVDLAEGHRTYHNEREALRELKRAGGPSQLTALMVEKKPGFAQRGDLVRVTLEGRQTYGICAGNGYWCGPGPEGLVFRPMTEAEAVFRI